MVHLFLGVKNHIEWVQTTAKIPILGGVFLFLMMFIPPVLISFLSQWIIPSLHNDVGFTIAMLILLPLWNIILWFLKVKMFLFFLPSWIILGAIALIKGVLMVAGIDNGQ